MTAPLSGKDVIKAEARRLGFILCGITTPERPPHVEVYEQWLSLGRQAEMAYLATGRARACRADPALIFQPGRSIIVLGLPYPSPSALPFPLTGAPHGRIAAYAWGEDYHHVIPPRLKELSAFIVARFGPGTVSKGFTDTAPILERELAQRAGLGWIGKNTCLIDPRRGSYFLLAELSLNLELEPDTPFLPDRCGTCTRCIQACPTACILPDRTLDAGRCISYLTIEKKGPIAKDLRPWMSDWVFGCDVCQMVCPWNVRFAAARGDPHLDPRLETPFPDLRQELALTAHTFNQKFSHSPVQRPHRRGYLRNVCIALGNSRRPEAVPALAEELKNEPEPLVRGTAAWALHQIGGDAARAALAASAPSEKDGYVLEEIAG